MFFTADFPGYALANLGWVYFASLVVVLFLTSMIVLAPQGKKLAVIKKVLIIVIAFVVLSVVASIAAMLTLGVVGAFLIAPLYIFSQAVSNIAVFVGAPVLLISFAVIFALRKLRHTAPVADTNVRWLVLMLKSVALTVLITATLIAVGFLYTSMLPRLTINLSPLVRTAEDGSYATDQKAKLIQTDVFKEYVDGVFPYRHERAGPGKSFATPEEFSATDHGVWLGVQDSLAQQFLNRLQFCKEHPIFGVIPSCMYTRADGTTYLILVKQ